MKKLKIYLSVLLVPVVFISLKAQSGIPQMQWPVGFELHDRVFFQMLVDHDPAPNLKTDYQCNSQYVYDGHRGTDITAHNFRLMDQGVPVLAAAEGTVTWTRYDQFDRNYWTPYIGEPNGINIRHSDGSNSQYWHLRQFSIAVEPGDVVEAGQFLGYIGSSGSSPIPHLHFELLENVNGNLMTRDPFEGDCHPESTLWLESYDYPGDTPINILDADIFNKTNLLGVESNNFIGETALKDRPFRPRVFGIDEEVLGFWVELQADPWEIYNIKITKPDGSIFADQDKTMWPTDAGMQWHVFYWDFENQVNSSDFGTWTASITANGVLLKSVSFEVGPASLYAPRFYPLAGRSFRINGNIQTDQLQMSGLEGNVVFTVEDAPPGVILAGDIVSIPGTSGQPYRNAFFRVTATDALGFRDTMHYHLVDISKPMMEVITSTENQREQETNLLNIYPNPAQSGFYAVYYLSSPGHVELYLHNGYGHLIKYIEDLNPLTGWNRHFIDLSTIDLPSGIYWCTIRAGQLNSSRKLLIR